MKDNGINEEHEVSLNIIIKHATRTLNVGRNVLVGNIFIGILLFMVLSGILTFNLLGPNDVSNMKILLILGVSALNFHLMMNKENAKYFKLSNGAMIDKVIVNEDNNIEVLVLKGGPNVLWIIDEVNNLYHIYKKESYVAGQEKPAASVKFDKINQLTQEMCASAMLLRNEYDYNDHLATVSCNILATSIRLAENITGINKKLLFVIAIWVVLILIALSM